tara:strand:- start:419 stop:1762 length:1344 start_codon:yes stop_codon:yes gene_type:complete
MNQLLYNLKERTDLNDKILILCTSIIPLSLAVSIFIADFLASISSMILIFFFLTKKNIIFFKQIKKEIFFFIIFYFLILLSLIFSNYKEETFLASFFYFRYFLLSLAIYYLLKKYDFYLKILFYSVLISTSIVLFDSYLQQLIGYNLLGYPKIGTLEKDSLIYLTSFFNEEKKLGSYLVRFLPLVLSVLLFYRSKVPLFIELLILVLVGAIVFYSSERTALFLLFFIYFFYFLINKKKIVFLVTIIITFFILFNFSNNSKLTKKYIDFTLHQTGLITLFKNKKDLEYKAFEQNNLVRYYSEEHENLSYTGLKIFQNNYLFGSGVKTFYHECENIKNKIGQKKNKRNNKLVCSTHPHNTYVQILSDIGIFGFILISYLFIKILANNVKIIFKKKMSNLDRVYFFINLNIIVNILPFIPSGSFFNNWMSLIIFFPLGFWLYIKEKYYQQ